MPAMPSALQEQFEEYWRLFFTLGFAHTLAGHHLFIKDIGELQPEKFPVKFFDFIFHVHPREEVRINAFNGPQHGQRCLQRAGMAPAGYADGHLVDFLLLNGPDGRPLWILRNCLGHAWFIG